MKRYLFTVTKRNENFVVSDLVSCAKYLNLAFEFENKSLRIGENPNTSFIAARLNTDSDALALAHRSTSVRTVSTLLVDGISNEELYQSCQTTEHELHSGTFAARVETCNRKLTDTLRKQYIGEVIQNLHITAKVDLKNPEQMLVIFIDFPEHSELIPNHIYVGVELGEGNSTLPDKFTLKKRVFINKTSMEASIGILSACQALCGPGKIIYDPFSGSGSLLVACAILGSHVIGSDFDLPSMYHDKDHGIPANFRQYNLQDKLIGIARCDMLKDSLRFIGTLDAIVTDPPYGIREKQIVIDGKSVTPLLPLLLKLYSFAAKSLKIGGRLVYWLPCGYDFTENELPTHPALKLISNCQQPLQSRYCRCLITLEKIQDIEAEVHFDSYDASFLKVRDLVFKPEVKVRGKNRKEKKQIARQVKRAAIEKKNQKE